LRGRLTCYHIDYNDKYLGLADELEGQGMTNADKIRSMSDKELAEMIGDYIDCAICKRHAGTEACPAIESDRYGRWADSDCYRRWLDWLRGESET
jgi:hypothetical protein